MAGSATPGRRESLKPVATGRREVSSEMRLGLGVDDDAVEPFPQPSSSLRISVHEPGGHRPKSALNRWPSDRVGV